MKKILIVYIPGEKHIYMEGQERVIEIRRCISGGNFWYWQVVLEDGEWLDIAAPAILEHRKYE